MKSKLLSGHELSVNDDQVISPTSTLEVARQLKELIQFKPVGTIHCAGNGFTSWYNLTLEIAKNIHIPTNKVKILKTSSVSGDSVLRPLNSSLENKKLKELNLNLMRDWDFSLNNYLNEFN
jgi:dTDP-4-dehydrorhamnose reductase